jgi:quercetin dioxygenase-like cupin family protein
LRCQFYSFYFNLGVTLCFNKSFKALNILESVFSLDQQINWVSVDEKVKRKVMSYSEDLMLVKVAFEKGGVGAVHRHPHLQISFISKGVFSLSISGKTQVLRAGDVYHVPTDAEHGAICIEEGEIIDVFSPMRADFL